MPFFMLLFIRCFYRLFPPIIILAPGYEAIGFRPLAISFFYVNKNLQA